MFIELEKSKKSELFLKLLSLDKIENENKRYIHAINLFSQLGKTGNPFFEEAFKKFNLKFDEIVYFEVIHYLKKKNNPEFETRVYVSQDCFNFIDKIVQDADLIFKNGSERKLHMNELKYYLARLTRKLITDGGHSQIARNYFLAKKTKATFKEKTGYSLNPNKVAAMNKIVNKYELLKVYSARQKKNLYIIGQNSPYFYLEGLNQKILKFNESKGYEKYWQANLTYADSKADKTQKKLEEKTKEAEQLKKQVASLESDLKEQKELVGSESIIEDNDDLSKRNLELLDEISKLYEKLEKYEKPESFNNKI